MFRLLQHFPALLLAAVVSIAAPSTLPAQNPQPLPVTVANPLAKRITTWDEYSGRFVAVKSVEVRPRVSGFIDQVNFKDGQMVKEGDLLFTIDKRPFAIAVESAKAEIARAEAQVKVSKADVERARPLVGTSTISGRDFDQRLANLSVAQAQLQVAEAALRSAELNLEWAEVRAPIAGRISDRKVDAGNLVNGGAGQTTLLATIVTLDPIHFVFEGSESDYLRYTRANLSGERPSSRETRNPVRIKLSDETGWQHEGRMDFVDNQIDPSTGTIRARALVENKDRLLTPGIFARLQLFGGELDALLIPDRAVVSDQARKIVFALDDKNTIVPKPVSLGPLHEGLRVILGGLEKSDRIVIDGIANPAVRPGVKVQPETTEIVAASAKQ